MNTVSFDEIDFLPDPATDERLMPFNMRASTNEADILLYKTAVRFAMENFLTPAQRRIIEMRYWDGMSKTEIGARLGMTPSAVCKKLNAAAKVLKKQAEYCMAVRGAVTRVSD